MRMLRGIGEAGCALQKTGGSGQSIDGRDRGGLRNTVILELEDPSRSSMGPTAPSNGTSPTGEFDHEALIANSQLREPRYRKMVGRHKCGDLYRCPSIWPRSGLRDGHQPVLSRR